MQGWLGFGFELEVLACLCFGILVSLGLQCCELGVQALLALIVGFGWQ